MCLPHYAPLSPSYLPLYTSLSHTPSGSFSALVCGCVPDRLPPIRSPAFYAMTLCMGVNMDDSGGGGSGGRNFAFLKTCCALHFWGRGRRLCLCRFLYLAACFLCCMRFAGFIVHCMRAHARFPLFMPTMPRTLPTYLLPLPLLSPSQCGGLCAVHEPLCLSSILPANPILSSCLSRLAALLPVSLPSLPLCTALLRQDIFPMHLFLPFGSCICCGRHLTFITRDRWLT